MPLALPWPHHWQHPGGGIRCVVSGCPFVTSNVIDSEKVDELRTHCEILKGEHTILVEMLRQRRCVYDGCSYQRPHGQNMVKQLFQHEKTNHNGCTAMSRIGSFVVAVREGRINILDQDHLKQAIFARMVQRLRYMGDTKSWIYWAGGFLEPKDHTDENLARILGASSLRPAGWTAPIWEPIPIDQFLINIAPVGDDASANLWRQHWNQLRFLYSKGEI